MLIYSFGRIPNLKFSEKPKVAKRWAFICTIMGTLKALFPLITKDFIHHLKNRNFAKFMLTNFDHWIVVEGHAKPGGSTSWCKDINIPCRSTDGTHEELLGFKSQHKNLHYYSNGGYCSPLRFGSPHGRSRHR